MGDLRNIFFLNNFEPDVPRDISQFDERTPPKLETARSRSALSRGGLGVWDRTRRSHWPEVDAMGRLRQATRTTYRS